MLGIGETELVIIVVFGFLLFGPDKLPGMGRTLGRFLRQFREAQEGFTQVVQSEVMDPLNDVLNDPSERPQVDQAELDADADVPGEGGQRKVRSGESFAERKARLKAEREAREAAEAEAREAAGGDDGAEPADAAREDDADAGQPAAPVASEASAEEAPEEPAEPAKPDTSAAALYAMPARRRAKEEEPKPETASEQAALEPQDREPAGTDGAPLAPEPGLATQAGSAADADGKEDGSEA